MSIKKFILLTLTSIFILGGLFFYQNPRFNDGKLHLVICDVGQGDAIYIRTPKGADILIDGGPDDSVLNCLSNHMPFWDRQLELVIASHPHADHVNGLISVFKRYNVMHYGTEKGENSSDLSKKLQDQLAVENLSATFLQEGDQFSEGNGFVLKTLWPRSGTIGNTDIDLNGYSVIELLSYGSFKALLTGDAGYVTEDIIAPNVGNINVLKVPHHGSRTGMDSSFLDYTTPEIAIISVGEGNKYSLPSFQALELLKNKEIKVLRTDKNGEIEIISDGKTWSVTSER